jgi:hypothetical protein
MSRLYDRCMTELTPVLQAARSMIPILDGEDNGAPGEYLTYRLTGFTVTEALHMCHKKMRHLNHWRLDLSGFKDAEHACTGADRGSMRKELLQTMFSRNFFLVMKKDQELLLRSLNLWPEEIHYTDDGKDKVMIIYPGLDTPALVAEWAVARKGYTAAQLQALEKTATGEARDLDIHSLILNMSKQENHYHAT